MKKSVAMTGGLVVVLVGGWLGATWYTGKRLEAELPGLLQEANDKLQQAAPEYGFKIEKIDYQRGFFSSQSRLKLSVAHDADLFPVSSLEIVNDVQHGPFPLKALQRGHFLPVAAFSHQEIARTSELEPLFKVTNGQSPITGDNIVSYNGDTQGTGEMPAIEYKAEDGAVLKFSGATMQGSYTRANEMANGAVQIASFSLDMPEDEASGPMTIGFQGLDLKLDSHQGKHGLALGNGRLTLQQLGIKDTSQNLDLKLSGLDFDQNVTEDDKYLNAKVNYRLGGININDKDFGNIQASVSAAHLDGAATKRLMDAYQKVAQSLQNESRDDNAVQTAIDTLLPQLSAVLAGQPSISLDTLLWKTPKGESKLSYAVSLKQPADMSGPLRQVVQDSVQTLDAQASLSQPMLKEVVSRYLEAQGASPEDAAQEADQNVSMMAGLGQMLQIARADGDNIISELKYAEGKATLNDREVPAEQVFGGLPEMTLAEALASATEEAADAAMPGDFYNAFSANDVLSAIQEAGYEGDISQDQYGDPMLTIKPGDSGAQSIEVDFYDCAEDGCDSILLGARLPAASKGSDDMLNDWNKSNRWTRAYRDDDGVLVLEMDVSATGGVAPDNLKRYLDNFFTNVREFSEAMAPSTAD